MSLLVLATAFLLGVLFVSPSAEAASWDPRLRWHSLFTEHFAIHYHQGEEDLAAEMALITEEVHDLLVPVVGWEPKFRTQVVLVDPTDSANGYATTIPNNAIVLYTVPPPADSILNDYNHWMWGLFAHEYAHILQIDQVGGIPQVLRWIFGRLIVPGAVLPGWLTEGFATWIETFTTTGGRGRSTGADTVLRVAALAGRLPPIDVAEGIGQRWPRGQSRYLYGARFHLAVEAKTSREAWMDFHRRHSRSILPLLLPAPQAFGESFVSLWKDWKKGLAKHYLAEAERIGAQGRGVTPTRILPTKKGQAREPIYDSTGNHILYRHSSPKERSSLRSIERDGEKDWLLRRSSPSGMVRLKKADHYLASAGAGGRYTAYRDLYRLQPKAKKARPGQKPQEEPSSVRERRNRLRPAAELKLERTRLTRGARISEIAPHPEGDWGVGVQSHRGQSQLVLIYWEEEKKSTDKRNEKSANEENEKRPDEESQTQGMSRVRPFTAAKDGSHYSSPSWSPNGELLAVAVWKPGGFRDIHVFDRQGLHQRALTWDRAGDGEPCWSPDGKFLVWASDRDGVWNLYASRWSDGGIFRITRLLGGARHPAFSPDGKWLAFEGYGPTGPRIEEIAFSPADWEPSPIPARALPGPNFGPSAQAIAPLHPLEGHPGPLMPHGQGPTAAVDRARKRADFRTLAQNLEEDRSDLRDPGPRMDPSPKRLEGRGEVRRYNPLRTLFPPRTLSLFGSITDTGALGGLSTGGRDILGQHSWGASLHYRTDSQFFGWAAGYNFSALRPTFSINYSAIALDYGVLWLRQDEQATPTFGTQFAGSYRGKERYYERRDRMSLGASLPLGTDHRLTARYKLEFRNPLRPLPEDVDPALLPARGSFSGLSFGWRTGRMRRLPASISPEDSYSFALGLDLESSYLGAYRVQEDGSHSELHRGILSLEARAYIALPWAKNHVLALRGSAGATLGSTVPQRTFRLGGPYGDNPYYSLPDRYYALRGYPTSSIRGDHFYLGSAEYRLPLFYVERGLWTAPIWLRSISLSIYAEAGQAFLTEDYSSYEGSPDGFLAFWSNTRPSLGAELSGDLAVAWASLITGRIGYGLGLGPGAYPQGHFYAQLGASF